MANVLDGPRREIRLNFDGGCAEFWAKPLIAPTYSARAAMAAGGR